MSGGFSKRVKKSGQGEVIRAVAEAPEEEAEAAAPLIKPAKGFDFRPKKVEKKENPLERKFAEIGQGSKDPTKPQAEIKDVNRYREEAPSAQPSALSFLESGDQEAQYLKRVIKNGQRIVEDYAQRPLWSTGIIELKDDLDTKLRHFEECEAAFSDKIDAILAEKLFPKKVALIPEEDIIARGEIFVVPKFLRKAQEEEGSTQEQLRRFLRGNKRMQPNG